jgi:hypothetical protein
VKRSSYQLEVKRRTRWGALPGVYTRLSDVEDAMSAMKFNLRVGAKLRARWLRPGADTLVGPTYTVHRDPGLRRKTDDNGWRMP